jgi:hypothetical protein
MSVNALVVASEAARRCGDPNYTRITRADWLDGLNSVARDISVRIPCVEYTATAATVVNEDRMKYPADLVQLRFVRYSETPGTIDYRDLGEDKLDEWREATSGHYQVGEPEFYLPRLGFMHLRPRPSVAVVAGVKIDYYGIVADVTDLTIKNILLPDMLRDYLVEGMVIFGKRKDKQFAEADALEAAWLRRESEWRDRASDRSRDRRTSLRATSTRRGYSGQV